MRFKRQIICLGLLALTSTRLFALDLGQLQVNSTLSEVLDARIQILESDDIALREIQVTLATQETYQLAELPWYPVLQALRIRVARTADNQRTIVLTSQRFIQEPLLPVLLNVSWPDGRIRREYTLFFDPPTKPVAVARSAQSSASRAQTQATNTTTVGYYQVQAKDTLGEIAEKYQGRSGATISQIMVALLESNSDLLEQGNINGLKQGTRLRIPERNAFTVVSPRQAAAFVTAQHRAWSQYIASGGTISAAPTTSPNSEPARGEPALKLVSSMPSDLEPTATNYSSSADNEAIEVLKLKLDLADTRRLLADREAEIDTMKTRMTVYEADLARLQDELAAVSQQQNDTVNTTETSLPEALPPNVSPTVPAAMEIKTPGTPIPPRDYLAPVVAGLLILLGVLGLVWYLAHKRRHDSEEQLPLAPIRIKPQQDAEIVDAYQSSETPTPTDIRELGTGERTATDILGEAEVFLQYGFYERGVEMLANALKVDSNNTDYRIALLKFHYQAENSEAFELLASTVQSELEADDPRWIKVCHQGRQLCPASDVFTSDLLMDEDDALFGLDADEPNDATPELKTGIMKPLTYGGLNADAVDISVVDHGEAFGDAEIDFVTKRTNERTAVRESVDVELGQGDAASEIATDQELNLTLSDIESEIRSLTKERRAITDGFEAVQLDEDIADSQASNDAEHRVDVGQVADVDDTDEFATDGPDAGEWQVDEIDQLAAALEAKPEEGSEEQELTTAEWDAGAVESAAQQLEAGAVTDSPTAVNSANDEFDEEDDFDITQVSLSDAPLQFSEASPLDGGLTGQWESSEIEKAAQEFETAEQDEQEILPAVEEPEIYSEAVATENSNGLLTDQWQAADVEMEANLNSTDDLPTGEWCANDVDAASDPASETTDTSQFQPAPDSDDASTGSWQALAELVETNTENDAPTGQWQATEEDESEITELESEELSADELEDSTDQYIEDETPQLTATGMLQAVEAEALEENDFGLDDDEDNIVLEVESLLSEQEAILKENLEDEPELTVDTYSEDLDEDFKVDDYTLSRTQTQTSEAFSFQDLDRELTRLEAAVRQSSAGDGASEEAEQVDYVIEADSDMAREESLDFLAEDDEDLDETQEIFTVGNWSAGAGTDSSADLTKK